MYSVRRSIHCIEAIRGETTKIFTTGLFSQLRYLTQSTNRTIFQSVRVYIYIYIYIYIYMCVWCVCVCVRVCACALLRFHFRHACKIGALTCRTNSTNFSHWRESWRPCRVRHPTWLHPENYIVNRPPFHAICFADWYDTMHRLSSAVQSSWIKNQD